MRGHTPQSCSFSFYSAYVELHLKFANYHTNIVLIEKNGKKLLETEVNGESEEGLTDRSLLDMENIWNFINTADIADIYKVLSRQIKYNTAISDEVDTGILGYNMHIRVRQFRDGDGIVTKGVDATICNIGRLGKDGMKETNDEIISIMVGNC